MVSKKEKGHVVNILHYVPFLACVVRFSLPVDSLVGDFSRALTTLRPSVDESTLLALLRLPVIDPKEWTSDDDAEIVKEVWLNVPCFGVPCCTDTSTNGSSNEPLLVSFRRSSDL